MKRHRRILGTLASIALAAACGGKIGSLQPHSELGTSLEGGAMASGPVTTGGGACVNVTIGPGDQACAADSDCVLFPVGEVCSGSCGCGETPINSAAAARGRAEIASLSLDACPCPDAGAPACRAGQCVLCPNGVDSCGAVDAGADVTGLGSTEQNECVSVATQLCQSAEQCDPNSPEGQICVAVANTETVCFATFADCVQLFSGPIGGPASPIGGALVDPAACAKAIAGGLCTKQGEDMLFPLPASCATLTPAIGCGGVSDAG